MYASHGVTKRAIERLALFGCAFSAETETENPYRQTWAMAKCERPDGSIWTLPLYWDGERTWPVGRFCM
jgi:hypothetical protein